MNKLALTAAGILAAVAVAAPASAVTRIAVQNDYDADNPVAGKPIRFGFNFDDKVTQPGFVNTFDNAGLVSGTIQGQYTRPYAQSNRYVSVFGGGSFQTFNATQGFDLVTLFIGSVDTYNRIELLNSAGTALATYVGKEIIDPATPNGSSGYRVTFEREANDQRIYGIRILSSSNSAEFDNLVFAAAVPEPSTWALMFAGFGLVGMAMRARRRRTNVVFS